MNRISALLCYYYSVLLTLDQNRGPEEDSIIRTRTVDQKRTKLYGPEWGYNVSRTKLYSRKNMKSNCFHQKVKRQTWNRST